MIGVILCGGQSTRMQKDKGLLKIDGITWAEKMALVLEPFCHKIVISVNANQPAYQTILSRYPLITDDLLLDIHGPLQGLLSVHQEFPEEDIFLLACDMQLMKPEVLKALTGTYHANPGFEAWVFVQSDGSPEPLVAIYSAKAMARMLIKHRETPLPKHSMKYLLDQLRIFTIPVPDIWAESFTNFNTPQQVLMIVD
jgi:molybdopterin-guanine dinucleotide biosynthesis protein A